MLSRTPEGQIQFDIIGVVNLVIVIVTLIVTITISLGDLKSKLAQHDMLLRIHSEEIVKLRGYHERP